MRERYVRGKCALLEWGRWVIRCGEDGMARYDSYLIRIWRSNEISDDVLHEFEEVLDYKESQL